MPTHELLCQEGLLHVRMSQVNHPVTFERLHQLFRQAGDGEVLGLFERMVDGMYGVEAYVQFSSPWAAARARDALDGHALYDGCCVLTVDHVPPIYTTIMTPDDDELARAYFYDDTPYDEWAAALALAERQYEAPASSNALAIDHKLACTSESASFHPSSPSLPHASAAVPLDSTPVPVCTASTAALKTTTPGASACTITCKLDLTSSPPATCSTVCVGGDSDETGPLDAQSFAVSDPIELPATCSTVGLRCDKGGPRSTKTSAEHAKTSALMLAPIHATCSINILGPSLLVDLYDDTGSPHDGQGLTNKEDVPFTFLDTAQHAVADLLDNGLITYPIFKNCSDKYSESFLSFIFKLISWYSQYNWPSMSFFCACSVSSYGQKMIRCLLAFGTVFAWLSLLHCVERKPWPPPYQIDGTNMQKFLVSLVELKHWLFRKMSLQGATFVRTTADPCHLMLMLLQTKQEAIIISYMRKMHQKCVCYLFPYPHGCHRPSNCSLQVQFLDTALLILALPTDPHSIQFKGLKGQYCRLLTTSDTQSGCVYVSWEIGLLVVSSCAYSDFGSGEIFTNSCQLFGSWGALISIPSFPVPLYCILVQSTALQLLEDALEWYPAGLFFLSLPPAKPPDDASGEWIFSLLLPESGVQFIYTQKYSIYDSEHFQWKIAWLNMKISDVGNRLAHFFFEARRCCIACGDYLEKKLAAKLHYFVAMQGPWDPGGSTGRRLEDKPNFKGEGLSATLSLGLGWAGNGPLTLGWGLLSIETTTTNTEETATGNVAWIGREASAWLGRLAAAVPSPSSSSRL